MKGSERGAGEIFARGLRPVESRKVRPTFFVKYDEIRAVPPRNPPKKIGVETDSI
jgi:hypothetical protein